MWKLLPVFLLVSCAANDRHLVSGENLPGQSRIVRQIDLPVESSPQIIDGRYTKKNFQNSGMQGWLDDTGAWQIKGEVHHGRLRCGTYETGVRLGRGSPACSSVEWLTGIEYVTRLRHCNSATRMHAGGGESPSAVNRFKEVSCVRIVVRCEGTC